jgi:hypothetical protein
MPSPTPTPVGLARPPRRSYNQIGDDGAQALAAALQGLRALETLSLS